MPKERVSLTHAFPYGGIRSDKDSTILAANEVRMAVNCELVKGQLRTRKGFRQLPLSFVDEQEDHFKDENIQGAMIYNPSRGISGEVFSGDRTLMLVCVGGKKFSVEISGNSASLEDVSNGLDQSKFAHLVWMISAENYALVNDGINGLWIWDSDSPAFFSDGYNSTVAADSKLPNGGTALVYAHGRVCVVVNARKIIVGDIIHKGSLTSPSNILDTTEQVYWATGSFFMPPSSMGNILAGALLPLKNTEHGHGEIIWHCEDGGQFSLDINHYPRSSGGGLQGWDSIQMVKHAMLHTSSRGPYAIALVDGDQIFRSQRGIDSMISASAESSLLGQPSGAISDAMKELFDADYEEYLRFASLINQPRYNRIWCTVRPNVRGRYRHSDGIVSINTDPAGQEESKPVFESVHTLPDEIGEIVQLLNGRWEEKERTFALVRSRQRDPRDGENKIVEYDHKLNQDQFYNDDGTITNKCIESQVLFRKMTFDAPFSLKQLGQASIFWKEIVGNICFSVYIRTDKCDWQLWYGAEVVDNCTHEFYEKPYHNRMIVLPKPPKSMSDESRNLWVEILVKWKGVATIETVLFKSVGAEKSTPDQWTFDDRQAFVNEQGVSSIRFNPYEYSGA